jgi:hypothetical protein
MRGRVRVGAVFSFALSILFLMPLLSVPFGGLMVAEGIGDGALAILFLGVVLLGLELTFTLASAARMSDVSVSFAPGFIPASLVFLAVLWRSVFRAWLMQPVRWRGREYRL